MNKTILRHTAVVVLLLEAACSTLVAAELADFVLMGGKVYTVNKKQPWVEAVAVRGKKIVSVGSNADVKKHVGDKTKIIDLDGKMLLPGFIESHIHPVAGALVTPGVDLQYD